MPDRAGAAAHDASDRPDGAATAATAIGAVILAAGAGTRLGGVAKALLVTSGGRTFLAQIVETARAIGLVDAVVVVGPPFGDAVAAHARALGLRVAHNPAPERGMASSIAIGFAAITQGPAAAAWLWPVDHADVEVDTLRALAASLGVHDVARPVAHAADASAPGASMAHDAVRAHPRGGHPPLVARAVWPRLAACADLDGGARAVLAATDRVDVAVADAGIVLDIDTPADLARRHG